VKRKEEAEAERGGAHWAER